MHECLLSRRERRDLEQALKRAMDQDSDRLLVLGMDPRSEIHGLGRAEFLPDPPWFYVGGSRSMTTLYIDRKGAEIDVERTVMGLGAIHLREALDFGPAVWRRNDLPG